MALSARDVNQLVRQLREAREEIERLRRTQISRAEHHATLGELATGLAHAIRNPLAGVSGVIEIVSRDLPASSPAHDVMKDVRREILRVNHIVSDLLQMARPHAPKIQKSDLNATVEQAVALGRQQALESIEIKFLKETPLEVEHDSDQIHQVMLHLLSNALHAIDESGTVVIKVKSQKSMALVEVIDTGRGIPPKDLSHIFRPFFTTKSNGTGLGLSVARRIVEDHYGRIEVSSTAGGTTFSVLLPLRRTAANAAP
jgi:signal transduction histidine kinase